MPAYRNKSKAYAKIKTSCFDQSARYLSLRDHSVYELTKKLETKEYTADEISKTLDRLLKGGYLDDSGYSVRYAASRVNRVRLGPKRVAIDLRRKGFSAVDMENALKEVYGGSDDEHNVAKLAAIKKVRSFKVGMEQDLMKQKLYDHLVRRGFSPDVSRRLALDDFDEFLKVRLSSYLESINGK